jgi:hypothetical protein
MTAFVIQCMVADKWPSTFLAQIILHPIRFLAIPFYLCALAIGAMERIFICIYKNINSSLIAKYLQQHAFYVTTKFNLACPLQLFSPAYSLMENKIYKHGKFYINPSNYRILWNTYYYCVALAPIRIPKRKIKKSIDRKSS